MTFLMSMTLFVFLFSILISLISNAYGFSLDMIPIDSPDLNFVPRNLSIGDRHKLLVNMSLSRVLHIQNKARLGPNAIQSQVYRFNTDYYVTALSFGTKNGKSFYSQYFVLDTVSDETWVQCEGCKTCFPIKDGNFNYTTSETYNRMDLRDPLCLAPRFPYDGSCGFRKHEATYSTTGFMGRDTFYFRNDKTKDEDTFPNIAFGCGFENKVDQVWANDTFTNKIVGIHGLGVGPRSFITQLGGQVNGRFSYCLPPYAVDPRRTTTKIYFGPDAKLSGDAINDVKTISMSTTGRYHLYVSAISVDGNRIPLEPSIFELDEEKHTKGFFIDSGSPYSAFPKAAYNPLKDAIKNYFNQSYGWLPGNGTDLIHFCYDNYPNEQQSFPSVTLHFLLDGNPGEVDMELGLGNMFEPKNNGTSFCLAVVPVPDPGPTLFGAFQQQNIRFLFDINAGLLQFVPENCLSS